VADAEKLASVLPPLHQHLPICALSFLVQQTDGRRSSYAATNGPKPLGTMFGILKHIYKDLAALAEQRSRSRARVIGARASYFVP
jgi:hypothetical protein